MSAVPTVTNNSYAVTIPSDFGSTLRSFATAKDIPSEAQSAIPQVFKSVMALKESLQNRTTQPTGNDIRSGVEILKQLRETYRSTLEEAKHAFSVASSTDRRIPLLGFRIPFLASKESRQMDANISTLKTQDAKMAAIQKQLEAKEALLQLAHKNIAQHQLTATLPEAKALTNQGLKLQMPDPKMVYINGNQQQTTRGLFDELFTALGLHKDESVLQTRANTFGTKEGLAPDNIKGRDLDALKKADVRRFDDMAAKLAQHAAAYTHKDGSQYFVPQEVVADRKIYISKHNNEDATISLQATFALVRKDGEEPVATVTATYTTQLGSTSNQVRFAKITPVVGLTKLPDLEKLERIFAEKAKISAPAGVSTAN